MLNFTLWNCEWLAHHVAWHHKSEVAASVESDSSHGGGCINFNRASCVFSKSNTVRGNGGSDLLLGRHELLRADTCGSDLGLAVLVDVDIPAINGGLEALLVAVNVQPVVLDAPFVLIIRAVREGSHVAGLSVSTFAVHASLEVSGSQDKASQSSHDDEHRFEHIGIQL